MTQNLISVIIPCYNRAQLIIKSVDSVLNQTYKNIELIVVDDGSTDNSLQVLEAIREKDNRVKVISQENKGPYPARNRGLKEARGEFIAFLDSDDTWDSAFLEKLHKALLDNPDAALAYCGWQNIGLPGGRDEPFIPPDYEKQDKIEIFLKGNRWPIHAALVRKKTIDELGGFDETFFSVEDYYLWMRIAILNKIVLVPEVLAYYYHHHDTGQISKNRAKAEINKWLVKKEFLKYYPGIANQLGRQRIKELTDGVLLEDAYPYYWRGEIKVAHKLFRRVLFTGSWKIKDLKYLLPALLPYKVYIFAVKSLRK